MTTFVALDPGFGNTKVVLGQPGQSPAAAILQSAVARPRQIGMAAAGLKTVDMADQVTMAGETYVAGENAWQWGEPLGGLDYSTIADAPRRALFYAAAARLLDPGQHQIELTIGLPVPLMQDDGQYNLVIDALRSAYKLQHEFSTRRGHYCLDVTGLKTMAQPAGAWADWRIGEDLRPRKGAKDAEVAILDIGMNTLDLIVVRDGKVEPRFIGGAKAGVRRVLASLNGHGQDMEEIDHGLRSGRLKPSRDVLDAWMASIFSNIERVWPDLRRFTAVVPVGGGALVLGDQLRLSLVARGAAVHWPGDPIGANARGLWKWAAYAADRGRRS